MTEASCQSYSVLMAVYKNDRPAYFREALESMLYQTIPTDDFVLVCDGPIDEKLALVISDVQARFPDIFHVVRLAENVGLGNAMNAGMKFCKHELIARMDSDDISYPDRCERQLAVFGSMDIDLCSGAVEEFSNSSLNCTCMRILPERNEEICSFARTRNPFNHPCVMFKKSAVEAVGGYRDLYLLEDYFLWVRMLMSGRKGYNIQNSILKMRANHDMYIRRSGLRYAKSQCALFQYMKQRNFISAVSCVRSCVLRICSACVPNFMREPVFKRWMRVRI